MYTLIQKGYEISKDKSRLNISFIHQYLSGQSYWAKNIPLEIVQKSIEGAVCFGVYYRQQQVGFARMVSDCATFGYLADVFICTEHRGIGLSKWLMHTIITDEAFADLRRWMLATKDAHELYRQFGFTELDMPGRFMQRKMFTEYPAADPE